MAKRDPDDVISLQVRMTEAMRAAIEKAAKANHRSMNGEVLHRLAATFGPEGIALLDQHEAAEKEFLRQVREAVRVTKEHWPGPGKVGRDKS